MGDHCTITLSSGEMAEVELVVPANYKYDDDYRNDFIHNFGTGSLSDRQIENALRRGWARRV